MPFATSKPVLVNGFLPLFQGETAPETTEDAASSWAKTYADYVRIGGGVVTPEREPQLAQSLTAAFNPYLAGAGVALLSAALVAFWAGLATTSPPGGTLAVFVPTSSILSVSVPSNASVAQQADALATWLHVLTLTSVTVTVLGSPAKLV